MTTKDFNVKGFCARLNRARRRWRISVCELRGRPIDACTKGAALRSTLFVGWKEENAHNKRGYLMSVFGEVGHVYVRFLIAHAPP